MAQTYVLWSNKYRKTYTGSSRNIERRLTEHNSGKCAATKRFTPWKIIYIEEFKTLAVARKREKYFKSHSGRKFLKKLLNNNPE